MRRGARRYLACDQPQWSRGGKRWYVPKLRERIPEFTPVDRPRAIPIEMSKEVLPVLKGRDHRMRRSSRSNTYLDVPPNPRKLERERSSTLATNHAIRTHLFKPNSSPSFGILDAQRQHHTPSMSTITRTKSCMRSLIVSKSNAASQCPVSIDEHKRAPKKKKNARFQSPLSSARSIPSSESALHTNANASTTQNTRTQFDNADLARSIGVDAVEPIP